ncbi:PcfJ domain-containing protein [Oceanobacillus kimchii]|uniref:PcfJ-like protein n=1 Tax=Oceanobacillus kimchii TaxID=746691 RepID=A0ABQ5TDF6_9BACI|nr:PcfJ domain-containing protein [Oceanobacillus kimchii]GLO64733.1 hypothetical protein MACH08_05170 [Oceanobacillus kimchii]
MDFYSHFPKQIRQELVDYVKDVVFLESRYLFVRKEKGTQYGYCSHCEKEYVTAHSYIKGALIHNQDTICDKCKSYVTVKSAGRGRKNLFVEAYVVWYEKSQVNPEAIVARGLLVSKEYDDYRNSQINYSVVTSYLFEPGYSEQRVYASWRDTWSKLKKIRSEANGTMLYKDVFISHDNVKGAVQDTPFQYSTWERYCNMFGRKDLVHFFDLAARYSCIEYLTKIGFYKFVEAKLTGSKTYRTINWNGATLEKVTRLSKAELKQLKQEKVFPKPELLYVYHTLKKHGFKVSFETAALLDEMFIEEALKMPEPLAVLAKYALKQRTKRTDSFLSYHYGYSFIRDLRDYWSECEELGLDLSKDHIKFPNDLQKAHTETSKRIKVKVDEALNKKIKKRIPLLVKRSFSHGRLHLRPAASSIELFEEGKQLKHCVGQYAKRYAEGDTDIYVVRKNNAPDEPFYTLEVQKGSIVQCRGFQNKNMTKEVASFIDIFEQVKLKKKKIPA